MPCNHQTNTHQLLASIASRAAVAVALFAMLAAAAPLNTAAQGTARVEIGTLTCNVAGGSGFIFGSTKTLDCNFVGPAGSENYRGSIKKFGIDIGATTASSITWGVLAPTTSVNKGALAGEYSGVTGEATLGLGVGANALVGGSKESIALQPLSVQTQQGLNLAAGVAQLKLYTAE